MKRPGSATIGSAARQGVERGVAARPARRVEHRVAHCAESQVIVVAELRQDVHALARVDLHRAARGRDPRTKLFGERGMTRFEDHEARGGRRRENAREERVVVGMDLECDCGHRNSGTPSGSPNRARSTASGTSGIS